MALLSKTIMSTAARRHFSNNVICKANNNKCPILQTPQGINHFSTMESSSEISQEEVRNGIQDIMNKVQELREMMKEAENLASDVKVNNISEVDEMKAKLSELEHRMTHIDLAVGFLPKSEHLS